MGSMHYTVTIEQVASKGTMVFETNFGFAFLADRFLDLRNENADKNRLRFSVSKHLSRVITVLSYCHQAAYKMEAGSYRCSVCKSEPPVPADFIRREYPVFEGEHLDALELLISRSEIDSLEAILVAQSIAELLERLWALIAEGKRTREILRMPEFQGELAL